MSLVVRKMPVPTTAPIVMRAPSHAPRARTRLAGAPRVLGRRDALGVAIGGEAIGAPAAVNRARGDDLAPPGRRI